MHAMHLNEYSRFQWFCLEGVNHLKRLVIKIQHKLPDPTKDLKFQNDSSNKLALLQYTPWLT